ncbi:MAG TPA: hypothetical protein HPP80_06485, partial [Rhodospirillaceae bacterium]|nr:hypothetical protein [Rhodospirillaceae bacterium]
MNGQAAHSGIAIAVGLTDRRITRLIIENHRILNATMPLVGLTPQDALSAIHRLFAICRMAQGVAGVTAIEDAGGLVVSAQQKAARRLLVAGETLLEQATQAALRWPLLMQDPPDFEGLKSLRLALSGLSQALYPDHDWLRVGGGRLTPDRVALAQALAMARRAVARLVIAQGQPVGAAARLLDRVIGQGLAGFGKTQLGFLPDLPAIPLAQ